MQILLEDQFSLLKDLEELSNFLMNSSTLVLRNDGCFLECQFIKEGLTRHVLLVRNKILAGALQQLNGYGIIEGASFTAFRRNFSNFALHVKAKQLHFTLSTRQPEHSTEAQQLAVA